MFLWHGISHLYHVHSYDIINISTRTRVITMISYSCRGISITYTVVIVKIRSSLSNKGLRTPVRTDSSIRVFFDYECISTLYSLVGPDPSLNVRVEYTYQIIEGIRLDSLTWLHKLCTIA